MRRTLFALQSHSSCFPDSHNSMPLGLRASQNVQVFLIFYHSFYFQLFNAGNFLLYWFLVGKASLLPSKTCLMIFSIFNLSLNLNPYLKHAVSRSQIHIAVHVTTFVCSPITANTNKHKIQCRRTMFRLSTRAGESIVYTCKCGAIKGSQKFLKK